MLKYNNTQVKVLLYSIIIISFYACHSIRFTTNTGKKGRIDILNSNNFYLYFNQANDISYKDNIYNWIKVDTSAINKKDENGFKTGFWIELDSVKKSIAFLNYKTDKKSGKSVTCYGERTRVVCFYKNGKIEGLLKYYRCYTCSKKYIPKRYKDGKWIPKKHTPFPYLIMNIMNKKNFHFVYLRLWFQSHVVTDFDKLLFSET